MVYSMVLTSLITYLSIFFSVSFFSPSYMKCEEKEFSFLMKIYDYGSTQLGIYSKHPGVKLARVREGGVNKTEYETVC